jgi:hypothetical protein
VTPEGQDAKLTASAELTNGKTVRLTGMSTFGDNLCLHPMPDGPQEAEVARVYVAASRPIVAESIVWLSTAP